MAQQPVYNPSRRKSRRRALDVLYSADLRDISAATVLSATLVRMGADVPDHMGYAVLVVDRNLCRIAVFELLYRDDIDGAVAISEAVELAGELSTDDSPRFVNGLL